MADPSFFIFIASILDSYSEKQLLISASTEAIAVLVSVQVATLAYNSYLELDSYTLDGVSLYN